MLRFVRHFNQIGKHRPRLTFATFAGAVIFFLLPQHWPVVARWLLAWNIGVWGYLASMAWEMFRASADRVRAVAEQENASTGAMLTVLSLAAVLSVAAIVLELAHGETDTDAIPRYGLTIFTVAGSWLLVGVIYTFHYAHLFYNAAPDRRPLSFPDGIENPRYIDFLYFSFTIAVAAQTSDVAVRSTGMRAAVLAQSVLAFLFNAAILGLTINIAAGLVGK
jgi:uncharacterized membrane protein